jgi:hypothetical protein
MKVGDLVRHIVSGPSDQSHLGEIGIIVDVVTHTETYASSGCKNYVILTARGDKYRCWKGELAVIREAG